MNRRPAHIALGFLGFLALLSAIALLHAVALSRSSSEMFANRLQLVRQLGLSDLALFTEARYTRHPSMADLHTAFQDHPVSFDHFPTGSLVAPSRHFSSKGGFAGQIADE
jgi:hypothetical protein